MANPGATLGATPRVTVRLKHHRAINPPPQVMAFRPGIPTGSAIDQTAMATTMETKPIQCQGQRLPRTRALPAAQQERNIKHPAEGPLLLVAPVALLQCPLFLSQP